VHDSVFFRFLRPSFGATREYQSQLLALLRRSFLGTRWAVAAIGQSTEIVRRSPGAPAALRCLALAEAGVSARMLMMADAFSPRGGGHWPGGFPIDSMMPMTARPRTRAMRGRGVSCGVVRWRIRWCRWAAKVTGQGLAVFGSRLAMRSASRAGQAQHATCHHYPPPRGHWTAVGVARCGDANAWRDGGQNPASGRHAEFHGPRSQNDALHSISRQMCATGFGCGRTSADGGPTFALEGSPEAPALTCEGGGCRDRSGGAWARGLADSGPLPTTNPIRAVAGRIRR